LKLYNPDLTRAARGQIPVDLVVRNALIFNPFSCTWDTGDFAVKDGIIIGTGHYQGHKELDLHGARVIPGLIDSHVHIESSLLTPREYARLVANHGTTTVIADPHEIANVLGLNGIGYMIRDSEGADIDIFYSLPSCVPSTPVDTGGAVLTAKDLEKLRGTEKIIGLGEMMNVPGVLGCDPGIREKLALCVIIDGHAPLLTGNDLNAYILNGPQSDHECTHEDEAREKLSKGMFIYLREGSTERNIEALLPVVSSCSSSRCSFATDDRHADILARDGHIDALVREALSHGCPLEICIRMATLTPAERFRLHDRGAIAPGRVADFCIVDVSRDFRVLKTYRRGVETGVSRHRNGTPAPSMISATVPPTGALEISKKGEARVIGIVPGQIITRSLRYEVKGSELPDIQRDIIKAVACSRYQPGVSGIGLVQGFGFSTGAIAGSVSHDAHNIIATGTSDNEIRRAIEAVILNRGGLAAVNGDDLIILPLESAGLMSVRSFDEVTEDLGKLYSMTEKCGAIRDPFMYLSFLCLPVIPELRLTTKGLFSVEEFTHVPLFTGQ
jgi:adenine deaminase